MQVFFYNSYVHAVSLHKVVEIREGQRTETFDRFPFERAKNRSFSLIYQKEGESLQLHYSQCLVPMAVLLLIDAKYVHLESLDLICHSPHSSDLWINDVGVVLIVRT